MFDSLSAVPLLSVLPEEVRRALAKRAEVVRVGARDWVFRQGDEGDALFVIRIGLVQVVKESGSAEEVIRVLGRGEFFGELALLDGAPRSASIRTLRDTELIRISQDREPPGPSLAHPGLRGETTIKPRLPGGHCAFARTKAGGIQAGPRLVL
jgi:signal-transduction protein with cAMP-binding, CBS, and nucleotidyltransferase domain